MSKKRNVLLALLLSATTCMAQRDRGVLTGTVIDSTGAPMPKVQLTIINTGSGALYK